MAEWWVEAGIGETRAALIDGGTILEAMIEPEGVLRPGTVLEARLVARLPERGQGIVAWADGEALLRPLPREVTQGGLLLVEIVREPIGEAGKPKRALARPASPGAVVRPGPTLAESLPGARSVDRYGSDPFEVAGWSELLESAWAMFATFPDGALRLSLTPAMTLIDVDGTRAPADLMVAGAAAAARWVRQLGVTGSIGIDLPSASDKAARAAAAEAIDAALPQPFERTAVNGFGFVQIVRRRARRSLPELYAAEPALAHARALLRRAERTGGAGERTLTATPAVIDALAARPEWLSDLERRLGAPIALRADAALPISAGHAQARHP